MTRPRAVLNALTQIQRTGRNPLAVYLLGLCVTAAVSFVAGLLAGGDGMKPVERLMPGPLVFGWYVLLFAGAAIAIVGVMLRDLVASLLVERAGLYALTAASAVYAAALLTLHNYVSGTATGVFALFCLWRVLQIKREIRHIRELNL